MTPNHEPAASLQRLAEAAQCAADAIASAVPDAVALSDNNPPARVAASRRELRMLGFWTSAAARKQLHVLGLDADDTVENLLNKALNLLFKDVGLRPIAPVRPVRAAKAVGNGK